MMRREQLSLQERVALHSDQQAFKQLFRLYYPGLYQFASSIVKCKEVAEEIVNDLFVTLWTKRESLTSILNFKVYVYIAVKNRCFNHISRERSLESIDLFEQLEVDCTERVHTPEDMMLASELQHRINKLVQELPPRCLIVYKLVKEEGFKYKEVAEILNISIRTVENQIAAAVRKIAEGLSVDFSEDKNLQRLLKQRIIPN